MSGARNAVIANMSPDIEASKKDQSQEYDNLEAAEVGSKFLKMGSQNGT
jgi:hypothetical protein